MASLAREPIKYRSHVDRSAPIDRRIINAMIYVVHTRKWKPRVLYLTEQDLAKLPKKNQRRMAVGGIPIRIGKHSILYGDSWHGRAI